MEEKRLLFCMPNTVFSTNEENSPAALQEVYFLPCQFWFSFCTVHRPLSTFLKGRHPLLPTLNALENTLGVSLACGSY